MLAQGKETDLEVKMIDVYKEFDAIRSEYKIPSWAMKQVRREYAFELPDVQREAQYLKVVYPYSSESFALLF
jgi:DNA polymerase alpha subunit A